MALYKINLEIMPIQSVLDPQGEAIEVSLKNLDKLEHQILELEKK